MEVLLIGHLSGRAAATLGFFDHRRQDLTDPKDALSDVAAGFRQANSQSNLKVIPWGPGGMFVQALEDMPGDPWLISFERSGEGWVEKVGSGPVFIELGHNFDHDWGRTALSKLAGVPADPDQPLPELLGVVRKVLADRTVVVASSTSRSLVGPGGTSTLDPYLKLRSRSDRMLVWRKMLDENYSRRPLLDMPNQGRTVRVGNLPGSGGGGGAAAALASLGARIFPTGHVLATALDLVGCLNMTDLLVVAAPHWHSPDLVDEPAMVAAEQSFERGIPTVGVGISSSLSHQERAEFGVNGLHVKRVSRSWKDLGRRVGQTWGTNYAG